MRYIRETVFVACALLALFAIVAHCTACSPAATKAEAEGAYGALLLKCVDDAQTLADSKACRAKVDAEWHVKQTAKDGGQ